LVTAPRIAVQAARIAASGGGVKVIKGNIEAAIFAFPRRTPHKNVMLRMGPCGESFILLGGAWFTKRE
jgi:hypothetical protein